MGEELRRSGDHEREDDEEHSGNEPPSDLYQIAKAVAELAALYFAYRQSEGAALAMQALAVLLQMVRPPDELS